jgi:hypothetical protein
MSVVAKMKLFYKLLIMWSAVALAVNLITYGTGAAYDSGGIYGFLWWSGYSLVFPVTIMTESLDIVGIDARGLIVHFSILSILLAIGLMGRELGRSSEAS